MMPRDAYSDRVAARVYQDNMEMARSCNRGNLESVSTAISWLETQAATHSDAGVLLDELRPIKHHLTCRTMMGPPKESGDPLKLDNWRMMDQQLKDVTKARDDAKAELIALGVSRLREDTVREIEHRNRRELALIQAAAQVVAANLPPGAECPCSAKQFLIAKWEEQLKDVGE